MSVELDRVDNICREKNAEIKLLKEALVQAALRFDFLAMHNDTMRNGVKPSVGASEIRYTLYGKS